MTDTTHEPLEDEVPPQPDGEAYDEGFDDVEPDFNAEEELEPDEDVTVEPIPEADLADAATEEDSK